MDCEAVANIRDIAKAIGVAAVVEGSVQRVANRVRINVQLVNAANDRHIWAEHYEKDVSDIFAAQRDVAFEIASSLHAQLSPAEKTRLERRPTSNGAAYLIYLQAQDLYARAQSLAEIEKMVSAVGRYKIRTSRNSLRLQGFHRSVRGILGGDDRRNREFAVHSDDGV